MPARRPIACAATTPAREAVVGSIRRAIVVGDLKPGDKLTEVPLAASLDVSRATLREALNLLVQDGLLVQEPYRGFSVTSLSPDALRDIAATRVPLDLIAVNAILADSSGHPRAILPASEVVRFMVPDYVQDVTGIIDEYDPDLVAAQGLTPEGFEARVRAEAMAQAEARGFDAPLVWAAGDGWHPGVVGIVAARLKEASHRPAVVIGFDGAEGKGSARSVTGVDLGAALDAERARFDDLA